MSTKRMIPAALAAVAISSTALIGAPAAQAAPAPTQQATHDRPVTLCPSGYKDSEWIDIGKHKTAGYFEKRVRRASVNPCRYKTTYEVTTFRAEPGCWTRRASVQKRRGGARGVILHYCVWPKKPHYIFSKWVG